MKLMASYQVKQEFYSIFIIAKFNLVSWFLIFGLTSCFAQNPYYDRKSLDWESQYLPMNSKLLHIVYLIGDAGEPDFTSPSAIKLLHAQVDNSASNNTVVFLGDNIYNSGMPEESDKNRKEAEVRLIKQMGALKNSKGKVFCVPGNHDWDHWGKNGLSGINREEDFVEQFLDKGNSFLPDNGCPGPVEVVMPGNMVLLAIDTQWWLHKWNKNAESNVQCVVKTDKEFIENVNEAILRNSDKQILVVAHHPVITNGNHGGYFSLKDHIFPFTAFISNLYIPLPILGSFHPIYRKYIGHIQDTKHKRYKLLCKLLKEAFLSHENLIFAAGHDHNLQYFQEGMQHYIVSGSGSKTTFVAKGHGAKFTIAKQGLVKLYYYENGAVWMEVLVINDVEGEGDVVYRKNIIP